MSDKSADKSARCPARGKVNGEVAGHVDFRAEVGDDVPWNSSLKPAFHDANTDILARILAKSSDTRDFLKLFLWLAEREDVGIGVVECGLKH